MAVRLPDGAYLVRRRALPVGRDAHLTPVPNPLGDPIGPYPGGRRELETRAWRLRLDPNVWPINAGDHIECPAAGLSWTVESAEFEGGLPTSAVAYVRVNASLRDRVGHQAAAWGWSTRVASMPTIFGATGTSEHALIADRATVADRLLYPPVDYTQWDFTASGILAPRVSGQRRPVPVATELAGLYATLASASIGGPVVARVNRSGVPIVEITIAAGLTEARITGLHLPLAADDYLTVDIIGVGSAFPGSDLVLTVLARRNAL